MFGCSSCAVISASWTKSRCARALPARSGRQRLHRDPAPQARVVHPPDGRGAARADLAFVLQRHGEPYGACVGAAAAADAGAGGAFGAFSSWPARRSRRAGRCRWRRRSGSCGPSSGGWRVMATDRVGGGSSVADSASGGSASGPGRRLQHRRQRLGARRLVHRIGRRPDRRGRRHAHRRRRGAGPPAARRAGMSRLVLRASSASTSAMPSDGRQPLLGPGRADR